MTEPTRVGELVPGVLAEVVERASRGYARWAEQVAGTGYCTHPVRLRGRVEHADAETGEVRTVYSTEREREWTAGVDLEAVIQENHNLHGEVERLRELLGRHGIDPDGGAGETA